MHSVPYDYISLFLRTTGWEAERSGKTVRALLKEYAQGKIEETASGLTITATSADGVSTTYSPPMPGAGLALSPEALALMIGRIWDQIDEIDAATPGLSDTQLLAALREAFRPVRTFRPGFHLHSPR